MACSVEPPVVTTSSTIRQRSSGSRNGPSMRRCRPCCLVSLRMKKALTSAPPASAAQRRGVGAHRQAADGGGPPLARARGDELGQGGEAGGAQDRALGVDVVLRDLAAGEHDLAHDEGVAAQLVDQPLSGLHAAPYPIGRARGPPADGRGRGGRDRAAQLRPVRDRRDARRVRAERRRRSPGLEATRASDPSATPGARARARALARARARSTTPTTCSSRRSPRSSSGSDSSWVRRGVPTLLALVVYGFGLSFLARYARGRA